QRNQRSPHGGGAVFLHAQRNGKKPAHGGVHAMERPEQAKRPPGDCFCFHVAEDPWSLVLWPWSLVRPWSFVLGPSFGPWSSPCRLGHRRLSREHENEARTEDQGPRTDEERRTKN